METSFFIKYCRYKTGIRFTIDESAFSVLHNQERLPQDEVFAKGFESLQALQKRLMDIFGETQGQRWFIHFVQDLVLVSEKEYRTNPRARSIRQSMKEFKEAVARLGE